MSRAMHRKERLNISNETRIVKIHCVLYQKQWIPMHLGIDKEWKPRGQTPPQSYYLDIEIKKN